jgi:ribonuclease PH
MVTVQGPIESKMMKRSNPSEAFIEVVLKEGSYVLLKESEHLKKLNMTITALLEQACDSMILKNRYPKCVIRIIIHPLQNEGSVSNHSLL